MSYHKQLLGEINVILDELAEQGEPWLAPFIAHQIVLGHADAITGDDEYWRHCAYSHTRSEVTRAINRRAGVREVQDQQMTMPGFEHLQAYYVVDRDGDEIGMPVGDMTDDELAAKAAAYRGMAIACNAHADEIDRYRAQRANQDGGHSLARRLQGS